MVSMGSRCKSNHFVCLIFFCAKEQRGLVELRAALEEEGRRAGGAVSVLRAGRSECQVAG